MHWNPWFRPKAKAMVQNDLISQVPVNQLGMKVLYQGSQVDVDIVAVHGLGAIPDITWREKQSGVNWLQDVDMLPHVVPNSRIIRFGYDSLFLCRNPVRASAKTIADNLLAALQGDRESCPNRPLIFIGHCFGGLVIQKALTLDYLESRFKESSTLLSTTSGIIFLGTPHSGTLTFTNEGVTHSSIISLLAASSDLRLDGQVLKSLESPHHTMTDISNEFLRLCSNFGAVIVINFFEQRSSKVGKLYGRNDLEEFVVDEASATLGHYPSYGLPLDHYSLNKFASPVDGNFKSVSKGIKQIYNLVSKNMQTSNMQTANMQTTNMQPPNMQTSNQSSYAAPFHNQLTQNIEVLQTSVQQSRESQGQSTGQSHVKKIVAIRTRVDHVKKKLGRHATLVLTLTPIVATSSSTISTETVVWKVLSFRPNDPKTLTCTWVNQAGFCAINQTNNESVEPQAPKMRVMSNQSVTLTYIETDTKDGYVNWSEPSEDNQTGDIAVVNKTGTNSRLALFTVDTTRRDQDQDCPVLVIDFSKDGRFDCSLPVMLQIYLLAGLEEQQTIDISNPQVSRRALFREPRNISAFEKERTTFTVYSDHNNNVLIEEG